MGAGVGEVTPEVLAELRAVATVATRGPWAWRGYTNQSIELRTVGQGGQRIIATQRSRPCVVGLADGSISLTLEACSSCRREYAKPHDPFVDRDAPCENDENLDTVWLRDAEAGFIRPANHWAVREVPYRNDVARVDHPDATYIARVDPTTLLDVLDYVASLERQLRSAYG